VISEMVVSSVSSEEERDGVKYFGDNSD